MALAILLPAAVAFAYVGRFGVSVVYFDQWEMVPLFGKLSDGDLSFFDLIAQHAEYRILFPKLAMLTLGSLTGYDNLAEMYLILFCFLVTMFCVIAAFGRGMPALALIPVGFLIFSLRQSENMSWGWQISFAFAQVFSVTDLLPDPSSEKWRRGRNCAPYGHHQRHGRRLLRRTRALGVTRGGHAVAARTALDGKTKRFSVLAWTFCGTGVWALYFLGYSFPGQGQPLAYGVEQPASAARFVLALLGNSLFWNRDFAPAGGAGLLFLAGAALFLVRLRGGWGAHSFWVALLLFSLATLATIAAGRAELGRSQASLSRYSTFSLLAVVAVYGLLVERFFDHHATGGVQRRLSSAVLLGGLCTVIVASVPVSYAREMAEGERTREVRETAAIVLGTHEFQPEKHITDYLYPRPEAAKNRATVLERLSYNVFADGRSPAGTSSRALSNRHPA